MSRCSMIAAALLCAMTLGSMTQGARAEQQLWTFDNLSRIGGLTPAVEGDPTLVDGPLGKAVRFDGVDDALLFPSRPLVGAKTFTIEAIFRPEGGAFEQRWLHVAETDPVTGLDANPAGTSDPNPRFMFEIRVQDGRWYLDSFVNSKAGSRALIDPGKTHPLNRWYAVQQTYDGATYRAYVDGVLEAEAPVPFTPHGPGRVMVGVRMNHVNWFRGAVAQIRFTNRALAPGEFLPPPPAPQ
ncbi:MAG: hypothetical protein BGN82_06350 [Alphaproteobacteria bacterium 65-7]|nr:MAG: hypothetical protein BGN82_06350 [Alphaproteobacteria bacterium 65-7]